MSDETRQLIVALTKLADHHDRQAQRAVQFRIGTPAVVGAAQQRVHQDAARAIRQILTQAHIGELPEIREGQPIEKDRHTGVVRDFGAVPIGGLAAALQASVDAAQERRRREVGEFDGRDT